MEERINNGQLMDLEKERKMDQFLKEIKLIQFEFKREFKKLKLTYLPPS